MCCRGGGGAGAVGMRACVRVGGGGGGGCDVGFARAAKEKIYVSTWWVDVGAGGGDMHIRPEELFGASSPRAASGHCGSVVFRGDTRATFRRPSFEILHNNIMYNNNIIII